MISSVTGKLPIQFEVVGFEDLDGKRHVKIKSVMDGTLTMVIAVGEMSATMKTQMTNMSWIDVATGLLTKSEAVGQNDSDFGVGTMTQQISTKVNRVKS
jgi:hypothetical protein